MKQNSHPRAEMAIWLALIVTGIIGSGVIFYTTTWGAIAFSDSAEYILSAHSLLEGKGLGIPGPGGTFQPLQLHPPLYPLTLAFLGWLGMDIADGARLQAILMFGLIVMLVGAGFYRQTRQGLLAILLSVTLMVSPVFIPLFSTAMSEGIFFVTGLLALFLVMQYLETSRRGWLFLAGIAGGLSFLARYTGFAWIVAGCLVLLIFQDRSWKNRLLDCLWLAAPAGLLGALWIVPLSLGTHSVASRSFQLPQGLGAEFTATKSTLIDTLWRFVPFADILLPTNSHTVRGRILVVVGALLGLAVLIAAWRQRVNHKHPQAGEQPREGLPILRWWGSFGLFAGVYLGVVVFSHFFSNPPSDLNDRLLSPFFLAVMLAVVGLLQWLSQGTSGPLGRVLAGLALCLPLLLAIDGARQSAPIVQDLNINGAGYMSQYWRSSPTIQAVKELPADQVLISNQGGALLFLTGHPAYDLAEIYQLTPSENFTRYGDGGQSTAEMLFQKRQALLVVFPGSLYWQLNPLYGDRTQERIDALLEGLEEVNSLGDGVIYRYPLH